MGLRVVNLRRPAAGTAGVPASMFCVVFPVGLFWVAFSRENRSLQDVVLRTSVIHDWLIRVPRRTDRRRRLRFARWSPNQSAEPPLVGRDHLSDQCGSEEAERHHVEPRDIGERHSDRPVMVCAGLQRPGKEGGARRPHHQHDQTEDNGSREQKAGW